MSTVALDQPLIGRGPRALVPARMRALAAGALSCLVLGLAHAPAARAVDAPAWPAKPVTLIVPFAAGGTTDIVARVVGQKLGDSLKQPVVIDNRAGAGGTVGATLAAHAAPDGYTLFVATVAHTMAPGLSKNLPYDFTRDLVPVGMIALTPNVLVINPTVPANTVQELITYIRAHPGQVNYGSAGPGSTEHLSGELFRSMTRTDITHVPYKGGAPMMTDLMSGQIQMAIETSPSASQHVRSGRVKALAVTSPTRSPAYPGVPTLAEAGVPGYEVTTWYALMAPRGTPQPVIDRLHDELARLLRDQEVSSKFAEQGVTGGDMTVPQLSSFIRDETVKWTRVAKESGATIQ